jgi:hypothetical protein
MTDGAMKTKCQTWNYLMLTLSLFVLEHSQFLECCGYQGGRQKIPYLLCTSTGQGDGMVTFYLAGTWFKFWSEDCSQTHSFFRGPPPSLYANAGIVVR